MEMWMHDKVVSPRGGGALGDGKRSISTLAGGIS